MVILTMVSLLELHLFASFCQLIIGHALSCPFCKFNSCTVVLETDHIQRDYLPTILNRPNASLQKHRIINLTQPYGYPSFVHLLYLALGL